MGHTNSTANLSLPQFIGTDKPTWLGDINSAFSDIDAYAGTNDAAVSGAVSDAASAISQAASAVSTANAANTTAGNASTAATTAVGTANNAMSLVNQTNTKIGTLANLHTADQTSIVNAINEVDSFTHGKEFVSVTADGIKTYSDLFDELYALVDAAKLSDKSTLALVTAGTAFTASITQKDSAYTFSYSLASSNYCRVSSFKLKATGSDTHSMTVTGGTIAHTDSSTTAPASGTVIKVIY